MKCTMFSRNNKNTIVSTKRRCIFCFRKDYMQNWKEGNKSKNIIINEAETTPLNIFPKIYVLIDKSVEEITLQTCRRTEIPPIPSKKAVITKFKNSDDWDIVEINWIPLVISKIPNKV